ncbi:MAG: WbqC family protein [Rhodobacterales bacterium]|nr:WbqC family protein [Rhodobacterales bacterium]
MGRIAIMQPYLLPYAGYFRLMVDVEALVLGDTQQFPRRGWVHRNRLVDDAGRLGWLTLPLAPQPLGTPIRDLAWGQEAALHLTRAMNRFAATRRAGPQTAAVLAALRAPAVAPAALIEDLLRLVAAVLDLRTPILRQSDFDLPAGLRPVDQIAAICAAMGVRQYVNAPGGRALYDPADFRARGLRLLFHPPHPGPATSILQRLADEPAAQIRAEILASAREAAE